MEGAVKKERKGEGADVTGPKLYGWNVCLLAK